MNKEALEAALPSNVKLIIGDVTETARHFAETLPASEPIGYVILDVDYYHSSVSALNALKGSNPEVYLPVTRIYMDDIFADEHNPWCGELLAVEEFNKEQPMRKICFNPFIDVDRLFKRASWLKHVWCLHTLDHPQRSEVRVSAEKRKLFNPYLNFAGNAHHTSLTTTAEASMPQA
jgi:hypothetical protein